MCRRSEPASTLCVSLERWATTFLSLPSLITVSLKYYTQVAVNTGKFQHQRYASDYQALVTKGRRRLKIRRNVLLWLTLLCCEVVIARPINVVTELFFPYQQLDANNLLTGYSVDVANELAAITGDELQIELLPWAVAYQTASTNPDTMIFSIGRTPEREPLFAWVGSIATETLYFWGLAQSGIVNSDTLSDFRQYRIAVVKEATTHQLLRANGFSSLYIMGGGDSNADEASRVNMLLKGRADIIIAAETAMLPALKKLKLPESFVQKVHRAKELDSELSIAFHKDSQPQLVARFQQALQKLKTSGRIQELKVKWGLK